MSISHISSASHHKPIHSNSSTCNTNPLLHNSLLSYYDVNPSQINDMIEGVYGFVELAINSKKHELNNDFRAWRTLRQAKQTFLRNLAGYVFSARCLSPEFQYNLKLAIFIDAVTSTYNRYEQQGMPATLIDQGLANWRQSDFAGKFMDSLMEMICHLYSAIGFAQRMADERQKVKRLYQSSVRYIDEIIAAHSKVIVIRLDFHQPISASVEYDMQQAIANMDRLIANMRHNAIFKHLLGYVVKLEYGLIRGAHWHAIFFFNGQIRNPKSHVFIAKQIGDYWVQEITGGYGTYYNCNNDIQDHESRGTCGIGLVERSDSERIQNLKDRVASYLCKTSLLVRIKGGKPFRSFRHGKRQVALSPHRRI
jgi:hypothetical protein